MEGIIMPEKVASIFGGKSMFAALGSLLISIIAPVTDIIFFIGIIVFMDTITGSWAAIKKGGWKEFSSKKGASGMITKLILYPLVVLMASGVNVLFNVPYIVEGGAFGIIFWEGKSFLENTEKILGVPILRFIMAYIKNGRAGISELIKKGDK